MTLLESKIELCRRLNIDYEDIRVGTVDLFDWDTLDSWINLAIHKAWDFHEWAFTEKSYTTDSVAWVSSTDIDYYNYPDDFVSDSIKLLLVENEDGYMKPYVQTNFEDYRRFRIKDTTDANAEKIWSSHQRFYFINPHAYDDAASRTIEVVGKIRVDTLTSSTALLPFSPNSDAEENSGNEAIVKMAYATALSTEKMNDKSKSQIEEGEALGMLNSLADKEKRLQAGFKHKDRPFFNVPKMF